MVLYVIVVLATVLRLHLRAKVRVWWWDDSLALLAASSMIPFVVGKFAYYNSDEELNGRALKVYYAWITVPWRYEECSILSSSATTCPFGAATLDL